MSPVCERTASFPRLHNSALQVDAIILTSYNVVLLELFTLSGRYYRKDDNCWYKKVSTPTTAELMTSSDVKTRLKLVSEVDNPLTAAKRKTTVGSLAI